MFKVEAVNDIGSSGLSDPFLIVAATFPDSPDALARNSALTTLTQLSIVWEDGASDGGSAILDYRVSYD